MTHRERDARVLVRDIAHARAGDKGNTSNVNVWVYDPADFALLKRSVTPERIKHEFPALVQGDVTRYVIDHLCGINLVMRRALEGGVNASLNLDSHGKSWSYLILGMKLDPDGGVENPPQTSDPDMQRDEGAPLVEVSGVTLQYKTRDHLITATYRVEFNVHRSDRFVLLGPSGCGKSTLLKAVGGYLRPVEGEIRLKGREVTKPGPDRMMVFQEFDQLLPWKTVLQNVMFPLVSSGKHTQRSAREKALALIAKVKLDKFADSYPHTLSGGMKQRVAIARGMAMEPDLLLMDEPFAALDALTRVRMQDELLALWDETKFTVIFVTHSIPEAIKIGNRILLLSPHPGQVKAEINSVPRGEDAGAASAELGRKIHAMLFADAADQKTE